MVVSWWIVGFFRCDSMMRTVAILYAKPADATISLSVFLSLVGNITA